jgi:16S rRNA (guanine527-N7)-methyltransferase
VPVQAPSEGFESRVTRVLSHFGLSTSLDVARRLTAYCELAVTWNQRVDLTAARSADELVDLLLADASAIASAPSSSPSLSTAEAGVETSNITERWLDVGSGVGAPGIPLALLLPVHMTLVEPREKRVAFLRTAVGSLARPDIAVSRARSDRFEGASCDVAVSRATLPPAEWLAEGARLATRAVWLLLAKMELPEIGQRRVLADVRYQWPLTGAERRAVCLSAGFDPVDS